MSDLLVPKDLPSLEAIKEQVGGYTQLDALAIFTLNELLRTARSFELELDKDLSAHGLTQGRHVALWCVAVLGADEGITPAEISDQLGVTRATITGLLDALEKEKLVVRKRRVDDRRKVSVFLTAKGVKKLEAVYPPHYFNVTQAMSVLSKTEKLQLVGLLRRLREASGVLSQPPSVFFESSRRS
ncbi:MarR family winged helix-turn-helix transcriptional regulator [Hyphomonas sp.]|uniref:MarR family winged helix-turn-helix transcriptional regulator n=1 Tax=Hyphomonas sp. TaxID=87 RepID=UPI003F71C2FA